MAYESFYSGGYSSLDPRYGFIGYRQAASGLALTTDIRTAAQVQEVANKLNTGAKNIEVSAIQPEIFESIPKQHLKEINRLSKLTGSEVTVHGPMIEASGYTREGWSEIDRQGAERQIINAIKSSHEMSPDGNVVVTFHSTAVGLPEGEEKVIEKVEGKKVPVPKSMYYVDPRTGRIGEIKQTEKYFPLAEGEVKEFKPVQELEKKNHDTWVESINSINVGTLRSEEILREIETRELSILEKQGVPEEDIAKVKALKQALFDTYAKSKNPQEFEKLKGQIPEPIREDVVDDLQRRFRMLEHADIFLKDSYRNLKEFYNMAYKDASPEDKQKLNGFAEKYKKEIAAGIEKNPAKLREFAEIIEEGVKTLNSINSPKLFVPLNDFLVEKSGKTFANAAWEGYDKFGSNAPIISIENPPAGGALSRAEDLKKLIEKTREEFVKKAQAEGLSHGEAVKASEKLIGATWDVGHINMLRKYGYENKQLIEQAETIKPFVKHIHLSDNFGMEHTELPMGMGNVPIKEIMEKLGKEGFEAKKVIEAGNWWQHMKTPPFTASLEAFGSPLYAGATPGAYWNQIANVPGSYFSSYNPWFPEQHFQTYGAGFSGMPTELGGQFAGRGQSRFSGTPES